jgi:hypothetical protein
VTEAVDVVSLLREQLEQHYEVRVGDGRPPASWMEGSELGRHLRGALSSELAHGAWLRHTLGLPAAARDHRAAAATNADHVECARCC